MIGVGITTLILALTFLALTIELLTKGCTCGKWLVGLWVVDRNLGNNPGFLTCFLRETIFKRISELPLFVGFLWVFRDKNAQTCHDKMVKTVVVYRKR